MKYGLPDVAFPVAKFTSVSTSPAPASNGGCRVGGKKTDAKIGKVDKQETLSDDLVDLPPDFSTRGCS